MLHCPTFVKKLPTLMNGRYKIFTLSTLLKRPPAFKKKLPKFFPTCYEKLPTFKNFLHDTKNFLHFMTKLPTLYDKSENFLHFMTKLPTLYDKTSRISLFFNFSYFFRRVLPKHGGERRVLIRFQQYPVKAVMGAYTTFLCVSAF